MRRLLISLLAILFLRGASAQTTTLYFTGKVLYNDTITPDRFPSVHPGDRITGTVTINTGAGFSPQNPDYNIDLYGRYFSDQQPYTTTTYNQFLDGVALTITDASGSVTISSTIGVDLQGAGSTNGSLFVLCPQFHYGLPVNLSSIPKGCSLGASVIIPYRFPTNYSVNPELVFSIDPPTSTRQPVGTAANPLKSVHPFCPGDPAACGEPISIATGNLFETATDYTTAGPNRLSFNRYYNSQGNTASLATELGASWRSNYDRYLRIGPSSVTVERETGQELVFTLQNGSWVSDSDVDYTLVNSGNNWTLSDPDDTVETYAGGAVQGLIKVPGDTAAALQTVQDRDGYTRTLSYTGVQLTGVTDSYGRTLSLEYQGTLLQTVTTPDGLVINYGYSSTSGSPSSTLLGSVSYVPQDGSTPTTLSYVYENARWPLALTGIIDENGSRYQTWVYDAVGRANSNYGGSSTLLANQVTIAFDNSTGNASVTNALGQIQDYTFTTLLGAPKLTEIDREANSTVSNASSMSFTYDTNGYLASQTDWNGNQTSFVNDTHGQPKTIIEATGTTLARTTSVDYLPSFHLPTKIVRPNVTEELDYDGSGNLKTRTLTDTTSTTAPYATTGQTRVSSFTYEDYGLLKTAKGARIDVDTTTTFTHDSTGALTQISNALGQNVQITQNTAGGRPKTIIDANGVTTQLNYDARQRLTSRVVSTAAGPLTTSFAYDPNGVLKSTTLPDGSSLTNSYDAAHRLTQVTDALGNYTMYGLDGLGDRTAITVYAQDGTGTFQSSGTFDALGRELVHTTGTGTTAPTTTKTFDGNGNALTVKDGLGHTTTNSYDFLNRLGTTTDANGGVTTPGYDTNDLVVSLTDANTNVTSYVRDGLGDVIQQTSPDSGVSVFYYDGGANLTSKTDALGIVTNQTFDALDRPLTTSYPADAPENVTYTYDQTTTGFSFGIGRLTSVTDAAGSLSRDYDERANLTQEVRVDGATILTTGYTYDGASRVASMTYPDGTLVNYQRDVAGNTSNVTATLPGASVATSIATLGHQPFGPINGAAYGNGVSETWMFDQAYRPQTIVDTLSGMNLQNLTYGYDTANNVKMITDAINASNSQSFQYDPVNRLNDALSGTGGYGHLHWTYDPVGNRLTQLQNSTMTQYGYTPGTNQLLTISQTTTQAALRSAHPQRRPADAGSVVAINGPPPATLPVRATGPPATSQPSRRKLVVFFGCPMLLIGLVGAASLRKRLLTERLLAIITVAALLTGLTTIVVGCTVSTPSSPAPAPNPTPTQSPASTPVFAPGSGTFSAAQTVTISDTTSGSSIYYTTNGTTPTTSAILYTGPIAVSSSETIEAIATASGYSTSAVGSAAYKIDSPIILPTAATPRFSPAAAIFTSAQSVMITDATPGAVLYYTLDGSTPTPSSTPYSGPLTVSTSETIQAIAIASGFNNSAVGIAAYTINLPVAAPTVATPTFWPAAGAFSSAQAVTISDATSGASIYYTTDGSTPTPTSALYSNQLTVSSSETIQAVAVASGYNNSAVTSATYTISLSPAAQPVFSPAGGTYTVAQSVTISDASAGAIIYYTTDGSVPTPSSAPYLGPITVASNETLTAIAAGSVYASSSVVSAQFVILMPAASSPVFSPLPGTFTAAQTVTISDSTPGAALYYTLDGSVPTTSSSLYSGPIAVTSTETVRAIAVAPGYTTSPASSAMYTINSSVTATPIFSTHGGSFTTAQVITFTDATSGAAIYYTTDGSVPTAASTLYTGPITVSTTETVMAIAVASGYPNSAVASAAFTITLPAAASPTFSPMGGTFNTAQMVSLVDLTPGATIYYTSDGLTPSISSPVYVGPITVGSTETISAIAVANGYATSSVTTSLYTLNLPSSVTITTNANGNITSIPPANSTASATFGYNNANRLSSVVGSPIAATFLYDYASQRFSKTDGGHLRRSIAMHRAVR